jgi:hypothetical protein
MRTTIRWNRFCSWILLLSLAGVFCLQAIGNERAQDQTREAAGANAKRGASLDLRGDLPNPGELTPQSCLSYLGQM